MTITHVLTERFDSRESNLVLTLPAVAEAPFVCNVTLTRGNTEASGRATFLANSRTAIVVFQQLISSAPGCVLTIDSDLEIQFTY